MPETSASLAQFLPLVWSFLSGRMAAGNQAEQFHKNPSSPRLFFLPGRTGKKALRYNPQAGLRTAAAPGAKSPGLPSRTAPFQFGRVRFFPSLSGSEDAAGVLDAGASVSGVAVFSAESGSGNVAVSSDATSVPESGAGVGSGVAVTGGGEGTGRGWGGGGSLCTARPKRAQRIEVRRASESSGCSISQDQYTRHALPRTSPFLTKPQKRLSWELSRLSPITKSELAGTVIGPKLSR